MPRSQIEDYINGVSSAFVQHEPVDVHFLDAEGKPEASRTRQEFSEECDINRIMARFEKTGVVDAFGTKVPQYIDVSEIVDLQTALEIVRTAQDAFNSLPATIRASFDNDPVRFVEFAEDPANLGQLRDWGLARPAETPSPPDAPKGPEGASTQPAP